MELVQGYAGQSLYDYADNGNADPPASDDRWKTESGSLCHVSESIKLSYRAGRERIQGNEGSRKERRDECQSFQNRRFNFCIYVL